MELRNRYRRLAAAAALVPVLLLGACGDDDGGSDEAESADTTTTADAGPSTTASDGMSTTVPMGGTAVDIAEYAFSPTPLTVAVGDTVTWTNQDEFDHTTTADEGAWDSTPVPSGETFEHTFEEAGTFPYHCDIHNFMKGVIVVE